MSKRKHAIEAYFQQGQRLHGAGRLAEAEQIYRQILAAVPTHADSLHMLGVVALQAGQPAAAIRCIDQAIALQPAAAIYHVNRANALLALGERDAAVAGCRMALRYKRNCAEAFQVMGHTLSDLGRTDEALDAYRDALRIAPNLPDLHNNLGLALRQANRLEEAAAALQTATRRAPADAQARSNLAGVMKELGRLPESEALYREALRQHPDDAVTHLNLAVTLLLAGRLADGWREYEWRFRAGAAQIPPCAQPQWQGEPLNGRTLLIRAEQGLGDMMQFCRYVPLVTGGRVVLEVHPPLRRLLSGLAGVTDFVRVGDAPQSFDLFTPLLSLPRLFDAPAGAVPYITAEPGRIAAWQSRLDAHGFRVGIAWQGNPAAPAERGRSVPLAEFLPLARIPGVRLISLQKQHGLDQLAGLPEGLRVETLGDAFDSGPDAFIDTAAVMQCLDLVVTSDTSVAHLAGAMGRPVWVALKAVPDWRWMLERPDSPWYPTMRLFRQATRGEWGGVFAEIARELAVLASSGA
jgi:tetratricopeptide (TPR) repeat protein